MSMTVSEIESAIKKLPPEEISRLSEWFEEFEAQMWDEQIASDLERGKLKTLIEEAEEDFLNNKCKPL
jgi:hypothetical protein